jgi:hypothetical protein
MSGTLDALGTDYVWRLANPKMLKFEREGPSFACCLGTAPLSIAPSTCRTIVDRWANDDPLKPARGLRATLDKTALISRAELEGASRPAIYLRTAQPIQPVGPTMQRDGGHVAQARDFKTQPSADGRSH